MSFTPAPKLTNTEKVNRAHESITSEYDRHVGHEIKKSIELLHSGTTKLSIENSKTSLEDLFVLTANQKHIKSFEELKSAISQDDQWSDLVHGLTNITIPFEDKIELIKIVVDGVKQHNNIVQSHDISVDDIKIAQRIYPRRTITQSLQLAVTDRYVSIDTTDNEVVATLYSAPEDGQMVTVCAVNLINPAHVSGIINGESQTIEFLSKFDSLDFLWNADAQTWEVK